MSASGLPARFQDELAGGPYRWVRRLAEGGMAEVHVVEHRELAEPRVMKVLKAQLLEMVGEMTARMRAEGRLVRSLRHKNLVEVSDFGFTDAGRAYLVMELLTGTTLKEHLKTSGRVSVAESLDIIEQTLEGLSVVHDKGLVHRDIKPDNIFYCEPDSAGRRVVKILDFGVAKILSEQVRNNIGAVAQTKEGIVIGTPLYFAPEQAKAQPVDARTDVYGLGGVLYHLLTGRPPFKGMTQLELFEAHIFQAPEPPSRLVPELPPLVEGVVLTALAKDPNERFASATAMLAAVKAARRELVRPAQQASVSAPHAKTELLETAAPVSAPTDPGTLYQSSPLPGDTAPLPQPPAPAARRGPRSTVVMDQQPEATRSATPRPAARAPVASWMIVAVLLVILVIAGLVGALMMRSGSSLSRPAHGTYG